MGAVERVSCLGVREGEGGGGGRAYFHVCWVVVVIVQCNGREWRLEGCGPVWTGFHMQTVNTSR